MATTDIEIRGNVSETITLAATATQEIKVVDGDGDEYVVTCPAGQVGAGYAKLVLKFEDT